MKIEVFIILGAALLGLTWTIISVLEHRDRSEKSGSKNNNNKVIKAKFKNPITVSIFSSLFKNPKVFKIFIALQGFFIYSNFSRYPI